MSTNRFAKIFIIFWPVLTGFGFLWLIASAQSGKIDSTEISDKYKPVEIESIKKQAVDLLSERQNVSGMPIPVPVQKEGKENPFSTNN